MTHPTPTWRPISEAPRDGTRVLVGGFWDMAAGCEPHCHGQSYVCIASWSTLQANGKGHQWFYETALVGPTSRIAVTFTKFMPIPPFHANSETIE